MASSAEVVILRMARSRQRAQAAADEEQGDVLVQAVVVAFAVEGRVGQDLPVLGQGVPQGGCAYVFAEADQCGGA